MTTKTNPIYGLVAAAAGGAGLALALTRMGAGNNVPAKSASKSGAAFAGRPAVAAGAGVCNCEDCSCAGGYNSECTCHNCQCASTGAFGLGNLKSDKFVLGYWAIRGLGAPLRMILCYVGANYEFRNFELKGQAPNWDHSSWFEAADGKPSILRKNALANLPYIEHQGRVITQSNACYNYLGRVFNLNGKTFDEQWRNDQCLGEAQDLRSELSKLVYGESSTFAEGAKNHLEQVLVKSLTKFNSWLIQQNTKFLSSDEPTTSDFHFWELLDLHIIVAKRLGSGHPLESFPRLQVYYGDFSIIPTIQRYLASESYALPMNMIYSNIY